VNLNFKDAWDYFTRGVPEKDIQYGGYYLGDFYNGGAGGDYGFVGYTDDFHYDGQIVRDAIVRGDLTFTHLTGSLYVKGGFEGTVSIQYHAYLADPNYVNGVVLRYKGKIVATTSLPQTQMNLYDTHTLSFAGIADQISFGSSPDGQNLKGYPWHVSIRSLGFSNLHTPNDPVKQAPPITETRPGPPVLLYRSAPSQMQAMKPTPKRAGIR
jgi:hypothetical protein